MSVFKDAVITKIEPPVTVFSERGRKMVMQDRPFWGISFCLEGQITYTHNGQNFVSKKGTAILLPKGGNYLLNGDKEGLFPLINFDCDNLNLDTFVVFPLSDALSYIHDYNLLSGCFLFDNKKLKQFQLLYGILEHLDLEQSKNPLSPITSYIENHISDSSISNKILAEKMHISEVYLRKLFLNNLCTTPKQYILDLRINKAKQLLTDSNFNVTKISENCGFSSLYHFCRIFKEKTGVTPTEYSKHNRIYQI